MRTLILTRGTPASGKSTFIKNLGLTPYTLEPDIIRLQVQAPIMGIDGDYSISQANDKKVWDYLFQCLEQRMINGDLTIIDATHSRTQQINKYRELCRKYRYRVIVVDFTSVDLDTILRQNRQRDSYKFVPEEAIKSIYYRLQEDKPSSWVKVIDYREFSLANLNLTPIDLDSYSKIKIVGDIHSSFEALSRAMADFNDNTFYIFLGDYLDRGVQTLETFEFINSIKDFKNVCLLEGNHETNIRNFILETNRSKQTKESMETLLTRYSIEDIHNFYNSLSQVCFFKFKGKEYLCTHGGLPTMPNLATSSKDIIYGVGRYEDDLKVQESFSKGMCKDIIQFYGHRNIFKVTQVEELENKNSYNLCGDAEFGGNLKVVVIEGNNIEVKYFKQDTFDKSLIKEKEIVEASNRESFSLENFKTHSFINVKPLKVSGDTIYAINFTPKAFKSRQWDSLSTKARGLFIDENSNIVARSYDKFFNYKEVEETSAKYLQENLNYPIKVFAKENGFLGILGTYKGDFLICSKSTNQGDFADMFRELIKPYLSEALFEFMESNNVTFVFEVNSLKDRHIVEYQESHLVLLDIIKNEKVFNKLDFETLKETASLFGFKVKEKLAELNSYIEWRDFRNKHKEVKVLEEDIEGFVLEDSKGFQFKLKSNYYNFWKRMRGIKDTISKRPNQLPEIKNKLHTAEEFQVYNFMIQNYELEKLAEINIIDIRNEFMKIKAVL